MAYKPLPKGSYLYALAMLGGLVHNICSHIKGW